MIGADGAAATGDPRPGTGDHSLCLRLLRHGETDWNVEGRIQGHLDVPLNERGRAQSRDAAERLAGQGAALVLTSDLVRARETADIVAGRLGVPVLGDPRLRERNLGLLQGTAAADVGAGDEGFAFVTRSVDHAEASGGESLDAFRGRVAGWARETLARPPAADVVVVTHGGAIRALLLVLTGSDMRDLVPLVPNCSVVRVVVDGRGTRVAWEDGPDAPEPARDAGSGAR